MKKLISAVLLILLLLCAVSVSASADAGSVAGGSWGNTVSWTLDTNGLLTVSGEGRMRDFSSESSTDAWRAYKEQIRRVVIGDGVTGVGAY